MDLVTFANSGGEDLPAAAPALWALAPAVPDPASMVLVALALAMAAGLTLAPEQYRLVQACYQQLTQCGAPDGPQQL